MSDLANEPTEVLAIRAELAEQIRGLQEEANDIDERKGHILLLKQQYEDKLQLLDRVSAAYRAAAQPSPRAPRRDVKQMVMTALTAGPEIGLTVDHIMQRLNKDLPKGKRVSKRSVLAAVEGNKDIDRNGDRYRPVRPLERLQPGATAAG